MRRWLNLLKSFQKHHACTGTHKHKYEKLETPFCTRSLVSLEVMNEALSCGGDGGGAVLMYASVWMTNGAVYIFTDEHLDPPGMSKTGFHKCCCLSLVMFS